MKSIKGKNFFSSWSGGKDACLALYRAQEAGAVPKVLLTMVEADGLKSRSHGLPTALLEEQAKLLGIPLVMAKTKNTEYEKNLIQQMELFKTNGIEFGVFGDIDLQAHYDWVARVTNSVGVDYYQPLWKEDRRSLLKQFIDYGFKTTIVATKNGVLDDSFLGRVMDDKLILELEVLGIDACGEDGEFHTFVTDGPLFSSAVTLNYNGIRREEKYCYLNYK